MSEALRSGPKAPVGSLVLIALMYVPWLLWLVLPQRLEAGESDSEFPGNFLIVLFGFFYLVAAIVLPIRLYRRRDLSRAHSVAFYASLGILALLTALLWRAT